MKCRALVIGLALAVGCGHVRPGGTEALRTEGKGLWASKGCIGCHTQGAIGTPIAPDLADINRKFSVDGLARWLRNPAAQAPNTHMPRIELTDHEIDAIVTYLTTPTPD